MAEIESFKIIGISTETTNQNGKSTQALSELWGRFYTENIAEKIPNKEGGEIYSIYTDYESDYRGKYTSIIGMKVKSLDSIPAGLIGRKFEKENYTKFVAQGEMPQAVIELWQEIWNKDEKLNRKYTADFEVYGENLTTEKNQKLKFTLQQADT